MLGANGRRPLALCQAAPDAASCFLPARAPRGERCSSLRAAGRRRRGRQGTARSGVPGADLGRLGGWGTRSQRARWTPEDARRSRRFPPPRRPGWRTRHETAFVVAGARGASRPLPRLAGPTPRVKPRPVPICI